MDIIFRYSLSTTTSESGIGVGHIQYLTSLKGFCEQFLGIIHTLMDKPATVDLLPNLFRF